MLKTVKIVVLMGLMAIGFNTKTNAEATSFAPDKTLSSISKRALNLCQNVSITISEDTLTKQIMVQAKGDWPLLTWLSREKRKMRTMIDRIVANFNTTPESVQVSSSDNSTIQAIILKTTPLIKQILTDLLHLNPVEATAFWQIHGNRISLEAETALRSWLPSNPEDLQYIKTMLEQDQFAKFINIIATIIKNQLNTASHLKAAIASLRNDVCAAVAA